MNEQEKQTEYNLSRIVKSTKKAQQPSEQFTYQLIDQAIAELPQQNPSQLHKRSFASKLIFSIAKIAAVVLVIGFVGSLFMMPKKFCASTDKAKQIVTQLESKKDIIAKTKEGISVRENFDSYSSTLPPSPPPPSSAPLALKKQPAVLRTVSCCEKPISSPYSKEMIVGSEQSMPMAHGGTTPPNGEAYDAMFFKNYGVNPFVDTDDDHFSTFATDVDTGSYTLCRQYLLEGNLPDNDAVRVEEFVNYFHYNYPAPQNTPFAVYAEAMPWSFDISRQNTYLMRVALKGIEIAEENRKPAVLTFVIDVSGSMGREDRLELVKKSLTILTNRLRPDDKIGIAVYGSRGRKVMEHMDLQNKSAILEAIQSLHTEGATNAEEGIRIGYDMAEKAFVSGCINRVILCSDGVANVGQTGPDEIFKVIKSKADKGITLSALGFGMGNYNDVLMEQLGDKGNGYYAYINTLDEAQKLFGQNLTGALQVIARDVKIQVEFDPKIVRSYRLIGYENRDVADQDFRNDKVDGGEMGAGHAATALYELKLWPNMTGKAATIFIRYKDPDTFEATEFKCPFQTSQIVSSTDQISNSFALAARVTEFAEILRKSYWAKQASLTNTLEQTKQLAAQEPANMEIKKLVEMMEKAIFLLNNQNNDSILERQDPADSILKPLPVEPN